MCNNNLQSIHRQGSHPSCPGCNSSFLFTTETHHQTRWHPVTSPPGQGRTLKAEGWQPGRSFGEPSAPHNFLDDPRCWDQWAFCSQLLLCPYTVNGSYISGSRQSASSPPGVGLGAAGASPILNLLHSMWQKYRPSLRADSSATRAAKGEDGSRVHRDMSLFRGSVTAHNYQPKTILRACHPHKCSPQESNLHFQDFQGIHCEDRHTYKHSLVSITCVHICMHTENCTQIQTFGVCRDGSRYLCYSQRPRSALRKLMCPAMARYIHPFSFVLSQWPSSRVPHPLPLTT